MTADGQHQPAPHIGTLAAGPRDAISDVAGITVGHCTLAQGPLQTGVTVIRPHAGDPYRLRPRAAAAVLNGFGKSIGLLQLAELGVLETPIALTNTFAVGAIAQAQIAAACRDNPGIGRSGPTVNPLVFECNDGFLNDIQAMALGREHYQSALAAAAPEFAQGSVGAGRGMSMFSVKGGIGSASRVVGAGSGRYMLGALVLANYGRAPNLIVDGRKLGAELARRLALAGTDPAQRPQSEPQSMPASSHSPAHPLQPALTPTPAPAPGPAPAPAPPESGSIIIVLATDAPLDDRQLRRLALRAGAGLARTGSVFGHGSGDIVLAFSTAHPLPQDPRQPMPIAAMLHDALLDPLFQAAADVTEQAILHALLRAESVQGFDGHERRSFSDHVPDWPRWS